MKQIIISQEKHLSSGLPKFTIVNMPRKCHKHTNFSIENLFFEDDSPGSPMTDEILN